LLAEGTLAPTFKPERGAEATPLSESPNLTWRRHRRRPLRDWQVSSPVLVQLSKRILEKGGVSLEAAYLRASPKSSARERAQRKKVRSSNEDMDHPL
jgi:hypothetical protein